MHGADAAVPAPVLFLMGPSGVGKTQVSLDLAARFGAEIVSVDSALVYRGLDIGTAKPNPAARRRIPHHLIDVCDPSERYSAARFRSDALSCIRAIRARGAVPLLVGGTGLYFRALECGLSKLPAADPQVRGGIESDLARMGAAALHARLAALDPAAAERIHPNDPQRIVRALEVHALTGKPMSAVWQEDTPVAMPGTAIKIVLAPADRAVLHERLRTRFLVMLERGLLNEVAVLRRRGDLSLGNPAIRAVGYREAWRYLDGELSREEMVERAVASTRKLVRRQLTWLRGEAGTTWFDSNTAAAGERVAGMLSRLAVFKHA